MRLIETLPVDKDIDVSVQPHRVDLTVNLPLRQNLPNFAQRTPTQAAGRPLPGPKYTRIYSCIRLRPAQQSTHTSLWPRSVRSCRCEQCEGQKCPSHATPQAWAESQLESTQDRPAGIPHGSRFLAAAPIWATWRWVLAASRLTAFLHHFSYPHNMVFVLSFYVD